MTKRKKFRKGKIVLIDLVAIVILFLMVEFLPIFDYAEHEIKNNSLIVECTNPHITGMDIRVLKVDGNHNSQEIVLNVPFDEGESYVFEEKDFQKLADTQDEIYIIGIDDGLLPILSNMTIGVAILVVVILVLLGILFIFLLAIINSVIFFS